MENLLEINVILFGDFDFYSLFWRKFGESIEDALTRANCNFLFEYFYIFFLYLKKKIWRNYQRESRLAPFALIENSYMIKVKRP